MLNDNDAQCRRQGPEMAPD